jgi:hypothetical protein
LGTGLAALGLFVVFLGADGPCVPGTGGDLPPLQNASRTGPGPIKPEDDPTRQVTVFAIQATPGFKSIDPRLGSIKTQLRKVLPDHSFKLLTVESKRIESGQTITCDLGSGYKAETILVQSLDENGKIRLRCTLVLNGKHEFSTLVKTPANQLFFYERSLKDGSRVVIGVGAR